MNKLYENIDRLVDYGLKKGLITDDEAVYSRNLLLDVFKENEYEETGASFDDGNDEYPGQSLETVLKELLDIAVERDLRKMI